MQLQLFDARNHLLSQSRPCGQGEALVYEGTYSLGDTVHLLVDEPGLYTIQLDACLGREVVYLKEEALFAIPVEEQKRTCYPTTAFSGNIHLMTLEKALFTGRRNLACNPYDHHHTSGLFPHAQANVETRGEMVFAARNAIDGVFANHSHGLYPFASWGINQDPKAELTLSFGRPVLIDEIRLTLRADWPHDSWWTEATVTFDTNEKHVFPLKKDALPQAFTFEPTRITSLQLGSLKKADDESPFPALTQLEVWGVEA